MTRALALAACAALTGCMVEAHGGFDHPTRALGAGARSGAEGAVSLGVGGGNDTQWGAVMMGIGASPLVGRDATAAPREPLLVVGGRYERAFTARRPEVRGYLRLMLGMNPCEKPSGTTGDDSATMDDTCKTKSAGETRSVGDTSIALGVTFAATAHDGKGVVPAFASIGAGLVYTFASDAALGDREFIGFELSTAIGGDAISPIFESWSR